MIWVVFDSNVYVSALIFGGNPRTVLELAEEGLFEVSVSEPIKAEVERVLAEKFSWPRDRIQRGYILSVEACTFDQPAANGSRLL